MRRVITLIVIALLSSLVWLTTSQIPAHASTGVIGGLDIEGYCLGIGDTGGTVLLKPQVGPLAAYNNWVCIESGGQTVAVDLTSACHFQYPAIALWAYPFDPNDAYTWNCASLPPAASPGLRDQDAAAVQALLWTDQVAAEQAKLAATVSQGHYGRALGELLTYLGSRSTQLLIRDVLSGYGLPAVQRAPITALLAQALIRGA